MERKASKWRAVAGLEPFAKVWLQYGCGGVETKELAEWVRVGRKTNACTWASNRALAVRLKTLNEGLVHAAALPENLRY